MTDILKKYWNQKPLTLILLLAVFFRILSVIFAKGWGMIDDHFLVIESAQSFVDGYDYNSWLPGSPGNTGPTGHNFFYPGLHFLLFYFLKFIHINDPQSKMVIVRLLNACWSVLTVYFGYKITERLSDKQSARLVGLLLSLYWFMPWASVRDLVEVACIPFLILAIWFIISREDQQGQFVVYFMAGLFLGLAFNVRPQTSFFTVGLGLAILIRKRWKELAGLILGTLTPIILIQGTIDYFIWGRPFAEILEYIHVNYLTADQYIVLPWYEYFLVILGFLVPPVSLLLFFGFLREWKKLLVIFLPVALFFLIHSFIINKQERFIMPILPFIIISGVIGWNDFVSSSKFWFNHRRLLKSCWIFFWTVNLAGLAVFSTVYSKKARVESMTYLSRYKDISYFFVNDADDKPEQFPKFYLGQWPHIYDELKQGENTDSLVIRASKEIRDKQPRFFLFSNDKNLQQRVVFVRKYFPFIIYETTIKPGFIDNLVHWLNPINRNQVIYIYRNTLFYREKIIKK